MFPCYMLDTKTISVRNMKKKLAKAHLNLINPSLQRNIYLHRVSRAIFAWSGYCLYKYSMMNAMGLAGFSISKLSTMEINNELIFLEFRYC